MSLVELSCVARDAYSSSTTWKSFTLSLLAFLQNGKIYKKFMNYLFARFIFKMSDSLPFSKCSVLLNMSLLARPHMHVCGAGIPWWDQGQNPSRGNNSLRNLWTISWPSHEIISISCCQFFRFIWKSLPLNIIRRSWHFILLSLIPKNAYAECFMFYDMINVYL